MVEQTAKLPEKTVAAVVPGGKSRWVDPAALQVDLQRYADDFAGRTVAAVDDYARKVSTPEGRTEALQWKIALHSSALNIATGPNPTANLLDFLALATLVRSFLEERAPAATPSGAFDRWLDTSRVLESNAWTLAERVLTAEQQAEFRDAIQQWHTHNVEVGISLFSRPQDFTTAVRASARQEARSGSVFSLVGLDPTSGLDPAVREVTRTRLFAERALYAAERMPTLMRWQVELLTDQLLRQDQLTNALASAERLSRATESASQTAALLPDRVTAERKAILEALEVQEGKLRELAAAVSRTLAAGDQMSTSLNTTLITFDALMKRFGVGEPDTSPPDTNAPPFNILDYARTAEQIAAMAQQLDVLLKDASGTVDAPALDKRIAQLHALSGRARADAKSVLNHAFLLAAALIVLGFAGAAVYRHSGRAFQRSR